MTLAEQIRALMLTGRTSMPIFDSTWNSALERAAELAEAHESALVAAAYRAAGVRARHLWHDSQDAEEVEIGINNLTSADAQAALARRDAQMRAEGRIEAGAVFSTTGAEERYVADTENACPACGGSGHKDDANAALDRIKAEAHRAGMREAAGMLMPAARDADLRAVLDATLARERALIDSNDVNRQARLDANAAHQRQVDSLRAEVERLRALLKEAGEGLAAIANKPSQMTWGEDHEVQEAVREMEAIADATLAKIGGQHD